MLTQSSAVPPWLHVAGFMFFADALGPINLHVLYILILATSVAAIMAGLDGAHSSYASAMQMPLRKAPIKSISFI